MKKIITGALVCLSLVGCAAQEPLMRQTASGKPEGIFVNTPIEAAKGKIMEGCTERRLQVYDATTNKVICGKTMEGGQAVMAQLLIGNSYSTTPEQKMQFLLFQVGNNTKVVADSWIETQMAFGQMHRVPITNNKLTNEMQSFLLSLGAE